MKAKVTFSTFTPSEAADIAGFTTTRLRDLRRHELIATAADDFDVRGLSRLLILRAAVEIGVGPKRGAEIAKDAEIRVAAIALNYEKAIDDRTKGALDQLRGKRSRGAYLLELNSEPESWATDWGDGRLGFYHEVPRMRGIAPERRMATLTYDLDLFASTIAGRAGRPLATVEIE